MRTLTCLMPAARRGAALGLVGACGLLALPAAASADESITTSPTLAGTLGGAGVLTVNAAVTNNLGGIPSPLTQLVINIPPGIIYNFATTPLCSVALIDAANGSVPPTCPSGSQIGAGHAALMAQLGTSVINETATLDIYLTSRSPVEGTVWGNGASPIFETLQFPGTFTAAAPPFAEKITVDVPPIPTVPGGPDASVVALDFTLGGNHTVTTTKTVKGRKKSTRTSVGLFDLPKKCAGGVLPYSATATFEDASTPSVSGTVACP